MGFTCGEEAAWRVVALSPPLKVRNFEMTVGDRIHADSSAFNWSDWRIGHMATKLNEVSRVYIENIEINQRTGILGKNRRRSTGPDQRLKSEPEHVFSTVSTK